MFDDIFHAHGFRSWRSRFSSSTENIRAGALVDQQLNDFRMIAVDAPVKSSPTLFVGFIHSTVGFEKNQSNTRMIVIGS